MLLKITAISTHPKDYPATEVGYVFCKNPFLREPQKFELAFGNAYVTYTERTPERCAIVLILDIDPVRLVRKENAFKSEEYINDRPYVASSMMAVAINQVFGTGLAGRGDKTREDLWEKEWPLCAEIPVFPCRNKRGGEGLLRDLFTPLGYEVHAVPILLDEENPDWGYSPYFTVTLKKTCRVRDLLRHLYILIPVLDKNKHYWIGDAEVENLLRHGAEWLPNHPLRALIARRYLTNRGSLTNQAIAKFLEHDKQEEEEQQEEEGVAVSLSPREKEMEKRIGMGRLRREAVLKALKESGLDTVLDLGCGEGNLLEDISRDKSFRKIVGYDVSQIELRRAKRRLNWEKLSPEEQKRIEFLVGSVTYLDDRLKGYDNVGAVLMEVIEHIYPNRIYAVERAVFGFVAPRVVIVTTPNKEYNILFDNLDADRFRHPDHKFEWTREEFQGWAARVAGEYGYMVRFLPVGPVDEIHGPMTQMAVFERKG